MLSALSSWRSLSLSALTKTVEQGENLSTVSHSIDVQLAISQGPADAWRSRRIRFKIPSSFVSYNTGAPTLEKRLCLDDRH